MMLTMIGLVSAAQLSFDDFETDSFSGGTGWVGAWAYTGNCEITSLSNPIDSYMMRGSADCSATRIVDTSSYQNVKVSFYATASSLENADHCKYFFDGIELLDLGNGDDTGTLLYYEYNVSASSTSEVSMLSPTTNGDYCYIDNVLITGDSLTPELGLYSELHYQKNSLMSVDLTSSLTSVNHQFEVYASNNSLICNETLVSPLIPFTLFSGTCLLPDIEQNNAYIKFSTNGANITKSFNIASIPIPRSISPCSCE